MKAIFGFFKQKWVIQLLGVIALCALIWFVGPRIRFRFVKMTLLEPELNRLLAIMAVVIIWAVYSLISLARSKKKDQQLMADLAAPPIDPAQAAIDEAQTEEAVALRRKFEEALQFLKKTRSKGRRDRQFLYELPWYVIIGAPGAGKTTLLVNSGLRFPLSEQLGASPIQGVGGTRNCDWLFADEAIFLDTAGRYTTQDSHQPVDAAAWSGFLDLIKKYRPRRPINGVLVTMSMSDLLQQGAEERRQQANAVRQRILELYNVLGVRFPLYMLFTKCDLVAGFSDFFAQFGPEERAQVWGETFPGEGSGQPDENMARFDANFSELLRRLNQGTFRRIQEERDIQRRSLILDFPQQMALLKPAMMAFLKDTFGISRFEETAPLLRGVYFTSGTQEGTPIDRIMGIMASTYGLDRQKMPVFSGQGKSFFITRLLKEVVFPEAELAGADPRVERRRRWVQLAAYASLVALTTGIIAVWSVSYVRNKRAVGRIENQIEQYHKAELNTTFWETGVRSLLVRLNIMQQAIDIYEDRSWWMGFGLYQGDKLRDGISRLYDRLLQDNLLPLVKARLEQRIHARLSGNKDADMPALYELLKVYLMLGFPDKMDRRLANPWIGNDWEESFAREPQIYNQLRGHSDNLLKLPLEALKLNDPLIAEARRILNAQPLYAQIFAHLQTETVLESYNLRLQDVLPPHSDRVFTTANGQALQALMIPGLYTYDGYHGFFKKQGLAYVSQALKENWVLNNYAANQESDLPRLYDDLQKHYFYQYKKQWHALLGNLKIKSAKDNSQAIEILDILSGSETPLRPLLETVEKNTTLSKMPEAGQAGTAVAQVGASIGGTARYIRELEEEFEGVNYLVRSSGDAPPPLDNVLASLDNLRNVMIETGSSPNSGKEAWENVVKDAKRDFDRQPEPFKGLLLSLTSSASEIKLEEEKLDLNAIWKTDVRAPYVASLQGRYPIYKNSRHDVTFDDFSRFFMPNGIIDQFFQNHLKPFVDTTQSIWRPAKFDNQTMDLSAGLLRQFQNAATVRDSFFAGGGASPSVQFELKPVDLDAKVAAFRINIEGQTADYRHGPTRPSKFQWPGPQTNAGVRLTFRTVAGKEFSQFEEGPWAWLRILDMATIKSTNLRDRFTVTFQAGGYKARYELRASSVYNPFKLIALQNFRCPESF
jgi:type VI secretion system protein ImpL